MSADRPRVLVIGFDGFTFDVIDPLVRRGRLPNIARLLQGGARGTLNCPPPTNSITGWTSFMTGTNIGKHGIYNFETMDPATGKYVGSDARMRANVPFWQRLSRAGKRVIVLNVVGSYPPDPVNGTMVAGKPVPKTAATFTHPAELSADLRARGYAAISTGRFNADAEYIGRVRQVADLACSLMRREDWDCTVAVFVESDGFQHDHPGQLDKIEAFYEDADAVVGQLLEAVDERTHVLLCSDHGHADYTHALHLERALYQHGFLRLKADTGRLPLVDWPTWHAGGGRSRLKHGLFNAVRLAERLAGRRPLPLPARVLDFAQATERALGLDPVDWRETTVFRGKRDGSTANSGGLRLYRPNLGIRAGYAQERDALLARLREILLELKDPETGRRVVEAVVPREELYQGPMLPRLPDIIVRAAAGYHCERSLPHVRHIRDPRIVTRYRKPKRFHTEDGVLILAGPAVRAGAKVTPSIFDIAPTVLHLLGEPVPSYMDGQVLTEALTSAALAARPVRTVEEEGNLFHDKPFDFSAGAELSADVRDELVRLGYE